MRNFLTTALLSCIVLGSYSLVLPRPRVYKRSHIGAGVFGGAPMTFKNSKDYYRKQSNNPYRRKTSVIPLLDLAEGLKQLKEDRAAVKKTGSLASLFDKNGMFYLTAPGNSKMSGRNKKPLLQKQLDQDYISLELLNNKRGRNSDFLYSNNKRYKPVGPKKRTKTKQDNFVKQLAALDKLLSLTQPNKKHQVAVNKNKAYATLTPVGDKKYGYKLVEQYKNPLEKLIGNLQVAQPYYKKAKDNYEMVKQFLKPLEEAVSNYNKPREDSTSKKLAEHYESPLEDIVDNNDFVKPFKRPLKKSVSNLQLLVADENKSFLLNGERYKEPREKVDGTQQEKPFGDVVNENNNQFLKKGEDGDIPYEDEILAILNDVRGQAAGIKNGEMQNEFKDFESELEDLETELQDLQTEFQFEDLVS